MSLLVQAQTSDNDAEILECINMVLTSSKLGLVHESVDVNFPVSYTSEFPGGGLLEVRACKTNGFLSQGAGSPGPTASSQ